MIGRMVMPGDFISISRNEIPCCGFAAFGSVRTIAKHQSDQCALVVQILEPLTMYSSPLCIALVRSAARSEPALGSEKPCDQNSSMLAAGARKRFFCRSEPN